MVLDQDLRNVQPSSFGDYIDFDLRIVDAWRQFRISRAALAVLGAPMRASGLRAFEQNVERIKEIAGDANVMKIGNGRLAIISSDIGLAATE